MFIPFLLGSKVDIPFAEKIVDHFKGYDIDYEIIVASAHKVPEKVFEIVNKYNKRDDIACYITIAGRSNGLSGVVAANSVHPVIACPPYKDKDDMMVNIYSTLQMPSDTPVMTVIDPQNAAMAVLRITGIKDTSIQKKIAERIKKIKADFN